MFYHQIPLCVCVLPSYTIVCVTCPSNLKMGMQKYAMKSSIGTPVAPFTNMV